jgi:uncharacterized protein YjbI with pentapeptide repeats
MDNHKLKEVLERHKLWVETDGKEGVRANLEYADLSSANLKYADLRGADLSGTKF